MSRLFGTDGVRGIANSQLTPKLCFNLGKAGAHVLARGGSNRPVFLIGMDTRVSGELLENAITAGILAVGGNVIKVGVMPTPAIAYLVKHLKADAGVVISASHNTFEYNGIKFFNEEGFKLDDSIENAIEDIIVRNIEVSTDLTGTDIGRCIDGEANTSELYKEFLLSTVDYSLSGKKIVLDCANGAAYSIAPQVYRALGAEVILIGGEPDGENINNNCGSTHTEQLQDRVVKEGAFMGMAFDGDADRLIAVDELGRIIDGDKVICICAENLKKEGLLKENKVTTTVMSNIGFHKFMKDIGCEVRTTKVGDRYVLEDMLKTGSVIGGEQSGHIIFLNHTTTGDGILSSLQLLKAVLNSGKLPSQLSDSIEIFPQVLKNAVVKEENKNAFEEDEDIKRAVCEAERTLGEEGRILIRASGTEPLVRVMIEGKDLEKINEMANGLARLATEKLG